MTEGSCKFIILTGKGHFGRPLLACFSVPVHIFIVPSRFADIRLTELFGVYGGQSANQLLSRIRTQSRDDDSFRGLFLADINDPVLVTIGRIDQLQIDSFCF